MLTRTGNPDAHNYHLYGGRGISVCERWHDVHLFVADIERDLGPRPDGNSLDRIDNEGNYQPGNVRWATKSEQNHNRRTIAGLTAERDALAALLAMAQGDTGRLF